MFRNTIIFSFLACLMVGCSEPTEAEKQEEQRQIIRDKKKQDAITQYKRLAQEYPENPNAEKAAARAKELEASMKK